MERFLRYEKPTALIIDVDGVMTDGKFYYTEGGKTMKAFGADDHDALRLIEPYLKVHFVTGDKHGLAISQARIVTDMKMNLDLVSTVQRLEWIAERFELSKVIYIGDGIFDDRVFRGVGYSIATSNADKNAKTHASYVTQRPGGDRAVAEACLHILDHFFQPYDSNLQPEIATKAGSQWGV